MLAHFVRLPYWQAVLSLLLLAGCATDPVLLSKDAAVPAGVDLSGRWIVRADSANQRLPTHSDQEQLISHGHPQRSRRHKSSSDGFVRVFLEFGTSLKITQTDHGIFISYDRSIVEEFTFGENRIVSIGPIEAMRVSGWEEGSFVVETVDDTGKTLYEAWHLDADNAVLVREIHISNGKEEAFRLRQVFDRQ